MRKSFLLILMSIFVFTACGETSVEGKWQFVGNEVIIKGDNEATNQKLKDFYSEIYPNSDYQSWEFKADGTYLHDDKVGGKYTQKRTMLELVSNDSPDVIKKYKVIVKGDTLRFHVDFTKECNERWVLNKEGAIEVDDVVKKALVNSSFVRIK